ncbi:MAG: sigma-54-dependent Fis family transcriptional regulator [Planctomycetes bacterium]|nr:sigma-54-dependent Fis family transcriptional regulator [Planctomycetota bacterium]
MSHEGAGVLSAQPLNGERVKIAEVNEETRELRWLRRVRDLSQALATEKNPTRLIPRILDSAIELAGAERGFLVLLRGQDGGGRPKVKIEAARGFDQVNFDRSGLQVSQTVVERVLLRDTDGVLTSSEDDRDLLDVSSVREGRVVSIVCVPLKLRGEVKGVLYLDHRFTPEVFQKDDLPLLNSFASQAALALETAELQSKRGLSQDAPPEAPPVEPGLASAPVHCGALVAVSPGLQLVFSEVERAARSWQPALVLGDPGSGKSAVAQEIHRQSDRGQEPLVTIDCASFEGAALESELFGHKKGAFPWATQDRRGALTLAGKGTCVLESVEALPWRVQSMLLRALKEEQVQPCGGQRAAPLTCRVVATSSLDAPTLADGETLRPELYYRLDVHRIALPPLREHPEDIPLLVERFGSEHKGSALRLSPRALELLRSYPWPGNVRQLENEARRLAALGGIKLSANHLSPEIRAGQGLGGGIPASYAGKTLADVEREMVTLALESCGGNKSRAARQLGIPRSTLYHLIERYGLE